MSISPTPNTCSSWCFICAMKHNSIPCGIFIYSILTFIYIISKFLNIYVINAYFELLKDALIKQNCILLFFSISFLLTFPFVFTKKYKRISNIAMYSIATIIQIICAYVSYLLVMTVFLFLFFEINIFSLKLIPTSLIDLYILSVLKMEIKCHIAAG